MPKALAKTAVAFVGLWFAWTVAVGAQVYPAGRDERAEIARHDTARQEMLVAKAYALADQIERQIRRLER